MNTKPTDFNLLTSSLEGRNLIDASAGTGKTYALTGLFIRLIVEKGLSVNSILVVTYTVAATEELRDRIRKGLRQAADAFAAGTSSNDFIHKLVEKIQNPGARQQARERLLAALQNFDEAAIFTIHGFCQRVLHENAFESGSLFDTELVTDQDDLKQEIVDDFWRKSFYEAEPELIRYAMEKKESPDEYLSLLGSHGLNPDLKIIPDAGPCEITSIPGYHEAFASMAGAWQAARDAAYDMLANAALNGNMYGTTGEPREGKLDELFAFMDRLIQVNGDILFVFGKGTTRSNLKTLEYLTAEKLIKATKKKGTAPKHEIFDLCQAFYDRALALQAQMEARLLFLKRELFRYVIDQLPRRKQTRNIMFFDDLLLGLRSALRGSAGPDLAGAVGKKYTAALIDEFQDTDPIQYTIFDSIFGKAGRSLFLIGDPKQSIYSFRNADIFAYMKASGDVKRPHTLRENWRSEPGLIRAVNTIFSRAGNPFVFDKIGFSEAMPAEKAKHDRMPLAIDGSKEPPFNLWFHEGRRHIINGKEVLAALTVPHAGHVISRAVAAEISRLIALGRKGKALLGGRPLCEGDIAVLVRKNRQAQLVADALADLGIPRVLYSTGDLLTSREASETLRVLAAIAEPGNETRLRAALATDMMGQSGEEIDALSQDEKNWTVWFEKFALYHRLWSKYGFIRMYRDLLLAESVRTRLLKLGDGERRLTNVLHLSEVLHQEEEEGRLGMAWLIRWLSGQVATADGPEGGKVEEHQLRLETDENAVKIVTFHRAKGLQYPVVFCPFSWGGSELRRGVKTFTFHDPNDDDRLTLDLGSDDIKNNKVAAQKELLAENLRLLYVALTRAQSCCYLVWGRFNTADTSAIAYLLHGTAGNEAAAADVVKATSLKYKSLDEEALRADLDDLVKQSKNTIALSTIGPMEETRYTDLPLQQKPLACRKLEGPIAPGWKISSFSSLTWGKPHAEELPDLDRLDEAQTPALPAPAPDDARSIFTFPRGAAAGHFMHAVFEKLDFTEKDPSAVKKLVAENLEASRFDPEWTGVIFDMVERVLACPLDPDNDKFTLSRVGAKDRLSELEFYYPIKSITPGRLSKLFENHAWIKSGVGEASASRKTETIGRLQFSPGRGFMKGYIDLVFRLDGRFYLLDWKSNFLGAGLQHYGQASLLAAMKKDYYILQYHIYAAALDQYLRRRLPDYEYEKHFGGVFYIFLRGVDPRHGPELGVYRDLPPKNLIEAFRTQIMAGPAAIREAI